MREEAVLPKICVNFDSLPQLSSPHPASTTLLLSRESTGIAIATPETQLYHALPRAEMLGTACTLCGTVDMHQANTMSMANQNMYVAAYMSRALPSLRLQGQRRSSSR